MIHYYHTSIHIDTKYTFFWSWINDHCDEIISQTNCVRCDDYSVTTCAVDENDCYNNDETLNTNSYCPYQVCRYGVLNYLANYMKYVYITV